MSYALITGSSEGIGRALAEECARNGWNILLVALPNARLEQTALEIAQQYPALEIASLGLDLTLATAPQAIYEWITSNGYSIGVLVNNAGVGLKPMLPPLFLTC